MENCLYHGKAICTFDLKDENGFYYEELVLEWKQAAADRLLRCSDCNANVYLAAGPVKEPYFAHYDAEECDYGSGQESEELKKGKRLLYQMMKRSFPEGSLYARYRLENGLYSTIYCLLENGNPIAVDFRLLNNSLDKFRERDSYYQGKQIIPFYVMGIRQEKSAKQIDWYQNLIQNSMGYLVFLDSEKELAVLKKSFSYRLGKVRKFAYCTKSYPIKELSMNSDGKINCDFWESCEKVLHQITEEKERYARKQEELNKLKEHYRILEQKESERLEQFRNQKCDNVISHETMEMNQITESLRRAASEMPEALATVSTKEVGEPYNTDKYHGLDPNLYEKCKRMIEEGYGHLVSKKYFDAITGNTKNPL